MKNVLRCLAILVASGLVAGSAFADQSCRFTLTTVSKIGSMEFKPGEYKLVVDAPKVLLTELRTGKEVQLEARIEDVADKNEQTSIHSTRVDEVTKISEIHVGGSRTKVIFN